jgi:hypothetical protein
VPGIVFHSKRVGGVFVGIVPERLALLPAGGIGRGAYFKETVCVCVVGGVGVGCWGLWVLGWGLGWEWEWERTWVR